MLRLSFDSTSLCQARLTGIGVYAKALGRALMSNPEIEFGASYRVSRWKKASYISNHLGITPKPYFPNLPNLTLGGIDIFHGPDFKIPKSGTFKKVVTVHDLFTFHTFCGIESSKIAHTNFNDMLFKCKPDHIITVSEFVKQELITRFPHTQGMVTAIHSGIDHLELVPRSPSEAPLFIYVGTIEARKNINNLVAAFEMVWEQYPEAKLILAGGTGLGGAEILNSLPLSKAIKAISYEGFVSNERRSELLSTATAFVYPSLYEGFGLPILEAMLANCPVITANFGACAEVSNGHGWEVNVLEPEAIADAMLQIMNNSSATLIKTGAANIYSQGFTWKKCAAETYSVYNQTLGKK